MPNAPLCTFEAYIEGDDFLDAYLFNFSSHYILTRVELRLGENNVPKIFRTIIDAQNFNWTIDTYKQVFQWSKQSLWTFTAGMSETS